MNISISKDLNPKINSLIVSFGIITLFNVYGCNQDSEEIDMNQGPAIDCDMVTNCADQTESGGSESADEDVDEAGRRHSPVASRSIIHEMELSFLEELDQLLVGKIPGAPDHVDAGVLLLPIICFHITEIEMTTDSLALENLLSLAGANGALIKIVNLLIFLE